MKKISPCKIVGFNDQIGFIEPINKKILEESGEDRRDFLHSDMFKEACSTAAENLGTNINKFLTKRQAGKFLANTGTVYEEFVKEIAKR